MSGFVTVGGAKEVPSLQSARTRWSVVFLAWPLVGRAQSQIVDTSFRSQASDRLNRVAQLARDPLPNDRPVPGPGQYCRARIVSLAAMVRLVEGR